MIQTVFTKSDDLNFRNYLKLPSLCEALWIFYKAYEKESFHSFLYQWLKSINLYVYLLEDDRYRSDVSKKIKDFKGAFGKHGLLSLNKNRVARKEIIFGPNVYYFDAAKVEAMQEADLMVFLNLLFQGKKGFLIASTTLICEQRQNDILDSLSSHFLSENVDDRKCFTSDIFNRVLVNGLYGILIGEDLDSTRSLIVFGSEVLNLLKHFPQEMHLVQGKEINTLTDLLHAYGYRVLLPNPVDLT